MEKVMEQIRSLFQSEEWDDSEKVEKSELLLEQALREDPQNTQLWMLRSIIVLETPIADYMKSMQYLNEILSYDPDNTLAWVLLAYVQNTYEELKPEVKDALLSQMNRETDAEKLSLLCLAVAWYYFDKDFDTCERYVKQSIAHCSTYSSNYWCLSRLYAYYEKNTDQIVEYTQKALKNLEIIYVTNAENTSVFALKPYLGEKFSGFVPIEELSPVPDLTLFMKSNIWGVHKNDIVLEGVCPTS